MYISKAASARATALSRTKHFMATQGKPLRVFCMVLCLSSFSSKATAQTLEHHTGFWDIFGPALSLGLSNKSFVTGLELYGMRGIMNSYFIYGFTANGNYFDFASFLTAWIRRMIDKLATQRLLLNVTSIFAISRNQGRQAAVAFGWNGRVPPQSPRVDALGMSEADAPLPTLRCAAWFVHHVSRRCPAVDVRSQQRSFTIAAQESQCSSSWRTACAIRLHVVVSHVELRGAQGPLPS